MFRTPIRPDDRDLGQGEEYELRTEPDRLYDLEHDAKIIDWRVQCFLELGFDVLYAGVLAVRRDVDREEVERLIAAGANPELAVQILL